jgi:hypothetical protein
MKVSAKKHVCLREARFKIKAMAEIQGLSECVFIDVAEHHQAQGAHAEGTAWAPSVMDQAAISSGRKCGASTRRRRDHRSNDRPASRARPRSCHFTPQVPRRLNYCRGARAREETRNERETQGSSLRRSPRQSSSTPYVTSTHTPESRPGIADARARNGFRAGAIGESIVGVREARGMANSTPAGAVCTISN